MALLSGKRGFSKAMIVFLISAALLLVPQGQVNATPLYSGVLVSDSSTTGNSISNANTSRCLAVAPDGTIYALYHGSNGIRVAKSTNGGASFSASVLVKNADFESEIAVSSNGRIFVAWVDSGNAYVSTSTDSGNSFSSPVKVGTAITSVHMASDADYLYLIDRPGSSFYYSSDCGQTFTMVAFGEINVFSDVHVNPLTHEVIVQKDSPAIIYYISNDHGKTFGAKQTPGASVNYSVGSISAGSQGTYLLVAGYSTMSARINLSNNTAKPLSFGSSLTPQGRSLSVDGYGNVVTGFISNGNVYYAVSQDLGDTFGETHKVTAASMANAAINTTNGDVMFLYEAGGKIYLSVYDRELTGYGLEVSTTNLNFENQTVGTQSAEKTITVTNTSTSDINVTNVNISGSDFIVTNNLGSVLKAGQSSTITVKFSPINIGSRTGQISILTNSSTQPRIIQLTGTGIAVIPPVITILPYNTNPTNGNVTVTASTDKGTLNRDSYTFEQNGSFTFVATDALGNSSSKTVTITNIDKTPPVITIDPYNTAPTNKSIIVTATTNEGKLNADSYTFDTNGEFTFTATDEAGNTSTKTITISNIYRIAPVITIDPYITTPTNQDITVTASVYSEVYGGATLEQDSYTFFENGSFTFVAADSLGNTSNKEVIITNIDKVPPVITIDPYNTEPINGSITVQAKTNEGTLNNDFHIFDTNGEFTFTATDEAGNSSDETVKISNIYKAAPIITINPYITSLTNQDITVTASVYSETPGGATLNNDSYTFGENGSFTFIAADSLGNSSSSEVTITNIDKVPPVITITPYNTEPSYDSITVYATTNEGTLNETSHKFDSNGDFTFTATDAAGNTSSQTVYITNISTQNTESTHKKNKKDKPAVIESVPEQTIPSTAPTGLVFEDVKGHWAERYIAELLSKGIIGGYPDGSFQPDKNITRAESAVVIVKALELKLSDANATSFKDDSEIAAWAKAYVNTAVLNRIMEGYEDNTFRGSNFLTRAEMSAMVMRAFKYSGSDQAQSSFGDDKQIPEWAKGYIIKASEVGAISGYPDNTFRASENITRAELCKIIYMLLEK